MSETSSKPSGPDARDLGLSLTTDRPIPDAAATPTPIEIPILFEDDILLVVNKPAGLATMPRGRYVARSVIAQLRWARRDRQLVAAHRLDRLTSGVLVVIKEPSWRGRIQTLFERKNKGLQKSYIARSLVQPLPSIYTQAAEPYLAGIVPPSLTEPFEVALPLLKSPGVWQCRIDPTGRICRTCVDRREVDGALMTWHLSPLTGYTHQLRATLAALGYPIKGDPLYPQVTQAYTTDAGDAVRMDLHARALTLPSSNGAPHWPTFTAPIPWEAGEK